MARDEFDNAGEFVKVADLEGHLVLFTPTKYVEEVQTSFGESDALMTDVVVFNEDGSVDEHDDVMIFQGALIGTLKRKLKTVHTIERDPATGVVTRYRDTTTRRVLGVLGKGEAKKGQSAPYILMPASDEQKAVARAYVAENPTPELPREMVSQYVDTGAPAAVPAPPQTVPVPAGGTDEFAVPAKSAPAAAPFGASDDPWATE